MAVSAWSQDNNRELPTTEALEAWANQYGISTPVVSDPNSSIYWRFGEGSLPQSALIGPGAEVLKIGHITTADIEAALQ